jgi:Leucine-rich repeat (LRR) protein
MIYTIECYLAQDQNTVIDMVKSGAWSLTEINKKYQNLLDYFKLTIYELFSAKHLKFKKFDSSLMEHIKHLKNLKSIDLSNCGLQEIPKFIYEMYNLEHVDFSNNDLIQIPKDFLKFAVRSFLLTANFANNNIYEISKYYRKVGWQCRIDFTNNPNNPNICKFLKYTRKFHVSFKVPTKSGYCGYFTNLYLYDGEPETNLIRKIENWSKMHQSQFPNYTYTYQEIKI